MTTRRKLLLTAGAGLMLGSSSWLAAQQGAKVRRIGFLSPASSTAAGSVWRVEALREGLRALGHVEGKNVAVELRWADDKYERLPALAAELVRSKVDVIVTYGTPGTLAAKQSTTSIPIVMASVGDAVLTGLVSSLARPDGNITGLSFFNPELAAKRLELLKEILPGMKRAAALINADNPAMPPVLVEMRNVAKALRLELQPFAVRSPEDLDKAFADMQQQKIDGVIVVEDAMLNANAGRITDVALRRKMPSTGLPDMATGAPMTYGVDQRHMFRRAAYFVDRLFKGAKVSELPIERATNFEMTVNLKVAKALGLVIPPAIIVRADKVIE